jgi:hypothetical protein
MSYITIYFLKDWHVEGMVRNHHFNWTCNSKAQAEQFARILLQGGN